MANSPAAPPPTRNFRISRLRASCGATTPTPGLNCGRRQADAQGPSGVSTRGWLMMGSKRRNGLSLIGNGCTLRLNEKSRGERQLSPLFPFSRRGRHRPGSYQISSTPNLVGRWLGMSGPCLVERRMCRQCDYSRRASVLNVKPNQGQDP